MEGGRAQGFFGKELLQPPHVHLLKSCSPRRLRLEIKEDLDKRKNNPVWQGGRSTFVKKK